MIGKKVMSVVSLDENQQKLANLVSVKNVIKFFVHVALLLNFHPLIMKYEN